MNLATAFWLSAEKNASKTAVFWGEAVYSYENLRNQARHIAARLQNDFAISPGDRVGLWLKNCPEFIASIFGVLQAGGVVVPINNFLKPDEVSHILTDAGAKVLISETATAGEQTELPAKLAGVKIFRVDDLAGGAVNPITAPAPAGRSESDLAFLIYTSGTTGRPKGTMLSHGNLLCNTESCRRVLETVALDQFVVLLPMFHSFMLCVGILLPMTTACSVVLVRSLHPDPKST